MFQLTTSEIKFTIENAFCRLVTSFKDKIHLVSVSHIYKDNFFIFQPIKKKKKLFNIKKNPNVSLTVDIYIPNLKYAFTVYG